MFLTCYNLSLKMIIHTFFYFLGENIYQVTHNGRILENQDKIDEKTPVFNEIELFATELLGPQNINCNTTTEANGNSLKLSINDFNANQEVPKITFDQIDVNVDCTKLSDLIQEINFENVEGNLTNDLLNMIDGNGK